MIKQLIAAAALAGVAAVSHAAEPASAAPFSAPGTGYIGFDLGATQLHGAADGHRSSYGGFLGYTFNSNFAAEFGVHHLYDWSAPGANERGTSGSVSVLGSVPVSQNLSLYGRLGVNMIKMHGDVQVNGVKFSADERTTRGLYGVGLNYKLSENVSARVEVQRPGLDLTNYSAGISYAF
jgi:OOP family OmpA-OmpF porin